MLRSLARNLLKTMGWRLVRIQPDIRSHADAFHDQQVLFQDSPPKIIFDVGANHGQTAAEYREHFADALIYSFEPFPETFARLVESAAGDAKIKPQRMALTNVSGESKLFVNKSHYTNSMLPVAPGAARFAPPQWLDSVTEIAVRTMTVDDFARQEKISQIDILKLDVQGAEMLALQGASALLDRRAISVVYCEVNFAQMYQNQGDFAEIIQFMREREYVLYGLYNLFYKGDLPLAWADAMFLSPALRERLEESAASVGAERSAACRP